MSRLEPATPARKLGLCGSDGGTWASRGLLLGMSATRQLLENIIDFAGTYPPAQLAPEIAFAQYLDYIKNPDQQWLVGHLVWGADKLDVLAEFLLRNESKLESTIGVTVVGRPSTNMGTWEESRVADAGSMNAFQDRVDQLAAIEGYEVRPPSFEEWEEYLDGLQGFAEADVFVELPGHEGFEDALSILAEAEWPMVKFRTGGTKAEAFPTSKQLANFLTQVVGLELPFKLTAGLHEPIAHHDANLDVHYHGFLNVVFAVGQILENDASPSEVARILDVTDAKRWSISPEVCLDQTGLKSETVDEVRSLFLSFGSCSVLEPLAGLDRLRA